MLFSSCLVGSNLDEFSTLASLHNLSQTALLKNFEQNNLTGKPDGRPPVTLLASSPPPPSSTSAMLASHQPWREGRGGRRGGSLTLALAASSEIQKVCPPRCCAATGTRSAVHGTLAAMPANQPWPAHGGLPPTLTGQLWPLKRCPTKASINLG